MSEKIKAYRVSAFGIDSVVFCKNPGQAKYIVFKAANSVGYDMSFSDISIVRRAPDLDVYAEKYNNRTAHDEEYIK